RGSGTVCREPLLRYPARLRIPRGNSATPTRAGLLVFCDALDVHRVSDEARVALAELDEVPQVRAQLREVRVVERRQELGTRLRGVRDRLALVVDHATPVLRHVLRQELHRDLVLTVERLRRDLRDAPLCLDRLAHALEVRVPVRLVA